MNSSEWDQRYATGHAEIDRLHRALLAQSAQIGACMGQFHPDTLMILLRALIDSARIHLHKEQDFLAQDPSPDAPGQALSAHLDAAWECRRRVTPEELHEMLSYCITQHVILHAEAGAY